MSDLPRVLVVDDDLGILELLQDVLTPDYAVQVESSLFDAVERLGSRPADLLIVDLNMPAAFDQEPIAAIRAQPYGSEVPILVISGDCYEHQRLLGARVQAVLEKPFALPHFLNVVKLLLAQRGTAAEHIGTSSNSN